MDHGLHWASILFYLTSNEITKHSPGCLFYSSWTTLLQFTLLTFFEVAHENEKNITRLHASVHFKNGPNAKNGYETNKSKNAHENKKKT